MRPTCPASSPTSRRSPATSPTSSSTDGDEPDLLDAARRARHRRLGRAGGDDVRRHLRPDRAARRGHRPRRRGGRARRPDADRHRRAIAADLPASRGAADATTTSSTRRASAPTQRHVHRPGVRAARAAQHRRRRPRTAQRRTRSSTPSSIISADPDLIFLADTKCCGETPRRSPPAPGWDDITAVAERQRHRDGRRHRLALGPARRRLPPAGRRRRRAGRSPAPAG